MILTVLILTLFFHVETALIDREHFPYLAYLMENKEFVSMGAIVHSNWIVGGKMHLADEARVGNASFKDAQRFGIVLSYDHKQKFTLFKTNSTMIFSFHIRRINFNAFSSPQPEVKDGIGVSWLIPNAGHKPTYNYGFLPLTTLPAKDCQRGNVKPPYFCTAPINNTVIYTGTPFIYQDHLMGISHSAFLTQSGMVVNVFSDVTEDDIINKTVSGKS